MGSGTLWRCLLACCALYFLALLFVGDAFGICHVCSSFYRYEFRNLEALQLGKLLHQLLHAVLLKLYCNLRVIPIAFATKDGSLAILRMPDPRTLLQPCLSGWRLHLQLWPGKLLSPRGKEAGDVVDRLSPRRGL